MHPTFVIASDHAGVALKAAIIEYLLQKKVSVRDLGTDNAHQAVDYPDFGYQVAHFLEQDKNTMGILICGSGIGISIAANRYPHIRAALCINPEMAILARAHNNANILVLGSRLIDEQTAFACIDRFISTPFEGGRHEARIDKLSHPV